MDTILKMAFVIYIISVFITAIIGIELSDSKWKYAKAIFIPFWPIIPILLLIDYINYIKQNNLNQMNLKILGKAMGFMFLPTLGVLLMLLIGFFDPISMWTWIKSDSAGAVIVRIIIFLLETGLVTYLYFDYLKKDILEKAGSNCKNGYRVSSSDNMRDIFNNGRYDDNYTLYTTEDPNVKVIKREKGE